MELWNMVVTLHRVDLQLVQVVEEVILAFALPSKHVDIVIDYTASVTITTFRYLARLSALDPSQKLKLIWIVPI